LKEGKKEERDGEGEDEGQRQTHRQEDRNPYDFTKFEMSLIRSWRKLQIVKMFCKTSLCICDKYY